MPPVKPQERAKNLLANLITCIACHQQMKIERSDPDGNGCCLVQYRCRSCNHIEQLRLSSQRAALS